MNIKLKMIEPENPEGNIEYKLLLKDDSDEKINNLASQMKYRINESDNGECFYQLGVHDYGKIIGITKEEYNKTIEILTKVAEKNNYVVTLLTTTAVDKEKNIYEVLIREKHENKYIDIKVCVAGSVDSGKSSIIGSLISGQLDDGRGLTRSFVFNFLHELKTGRTSSAAHHILGFDVKGNVVNNQSISKLSWQEIVERSSKVISFVDLCGHSRYLKTTILGLSSSFPDICIIMIGANSGVLTMSKEHILLCLTLKIPFIFVISKIDICKDRKNIIDETVTSINKTLKHPIVRRMPLYVKNTDDILLAIKNVYNMSVVPIFYTSTVTGEGIDLLKNFLNLIGKNPKEIINSGDNNIVEYHIDHLFYVKGFGDVVGGNLMSGKIQVGDKLLLGPNLNQYDQVIVRTIYCKKIPLQNINAAGQYVCLGLKKIDTKIKRGNVIISSNHEKLIVKTFSAKITVLRTHSTTIRKNYEPILSAYSIRQVVKIVEIKDKQNFRTGEQNLKDEILRSGDSATVKFLFKYNSQFFKIGTRFILAEGSTKMTGEVVEIE